MAGEPQTDEDAQKSEPLDAERPERPGVAPASQLPATTFYEVRGQTYAVTDMGGDGPPVLLMHGWPDERSIYRHQLPVLREAGYRAISVDWIGHGESSIPKARNRYRIPELSRDLVALLDSLDIDRCHLVAHDYGATVCWEFAADNSHRLITFSALSVGPSIEILVDIFKGSLFWYHWLLLHAFDRLSRWVYLRNGGKRFQGRFGKHPDRDLILARLKGGGDQTFWTIWEAANPSHSVLFRWFRSGRKKRITAPTLALYSDDDVWMTIGQISRGYRHVSGKWRFETLDCGHSLQLERPEDVNRVLLDWFAQV